MFSWTCNTDTLKASLSFKEWIDLEIIIVQVLCAAVGMTEVWETVNNEWSNVSVTDATMGFMAAHTHTVSGVDVQVWLLSPSSSPVMLVLKSRSKLREWGWGWEKGGWENLRRKPLDVARKWGDWGSFPGIWLGDWLFGKSINQEWGGMREWIKFDIQTLRCLWNI